MAARKDPRIVEDHRARIKTSQLVNRLQSNALGELPEELSSGQLKSIEILLRKSVPDLQAVTISGDPDNPVVMNAIIVPAKSGA